MSDIVKWGLLVAGLVGIVALCSLILDGINLALIAVGLNEAVYTITETLADLLQAARGVLNNIIDPWVLDVLLFVSVMYPIYKFAVRRLGWLYAWIFK